MINCSQVGVLAAFVLGSISVTAPSWAQVVDGTSGRVSRCDMFRSLGKALPPECGGTGPATSGATRGRVVIGAPATAPAAAVPVAAPRPAATSPAAPSATVAPAAVPSPTTAATTMAPAPKGLGLPIPFALDSDELTADAMKVVDDLADVFKANAGDRFIIEGHTDALGDPAYNRALSDRRARAVVAYLVARHGLPGDRFVARGQGSTQLLLPADPINGRNRRVQVLNVGS